MPLIRVALAEDHHLVREGMRALLERARGIEVVAEADNGRTAIELVRSLEPDVLVMDIAMPLLNGLQATEQLQSLDVKTRVVILSLYADHALVLQALRYGACGYLVKSSVSEELVLAIGAASRGETYISPALLGPVLAHALDDGDPRGGTSASDLNLESEIRERIAKSLTPRERQVLRLVSEGHTCREIAAELHISTKTAEKHRSNLMRKLGEHDVVGLARAVLNQRIASEDLPR